MKNSAKVYPGGEGLDGKAVAWMICLLLVVVALSAFAGWLVTRARRIDAVHRRVLASRQRLEIALMKRGAHANHAATLARQDQALDPQRRAVIDELLDASLKVTNMGGVGLAEDGLDIRHSREPAQESVQSHTGAEMVQQRLANESLLSQTARQVFDGKTREYLKRDSLARAALAAFDEESYKVRVLRYVHNQDVAQVAILRKGYVSRYFRLAGRAPLPQMVDFDDKT